MYRHLRAGTSNRDELQSEDVAPVAEWPFVGRHLELNLLNEAWNTAREGGAHLVLVTGEPGIGKSRLALEFGRRVRAEGHMVAWARAYEAAGRLPWGPVVDLLRSDALRSHIDTLEVVWRVELARLLPELLGASQPRGPSRSGDLAQRHRLFDAVSRAIVGDRPRLLIIDDLQWCDAETIELIGFVVRSRQTAPVLIVGTVRSEEIAKHHPLVGLLDALGHDQAVTTVPLDPLDEATTATLAARLHNPDPIDPELAARLWAETEGNPLFVIETLRAGVSPHGSQAMPTPTMRAVLGARLGQLGDQTEQTFVASAAVGDFTVVSIGNAREVVEPSVTGSAYSAIGIHSRLANQHRPSATKPRVRAAATVAPTDTSAPALAIDTSGSTVPRACSTSGVSPRADHSILSGPCSPRRVGCVTTAVSGARLLQPPANRLRIRK
ncbi:MAG: ATP-binding protein [Acidimicrobiales bacterium]